MIKSGKKLVNQVNLTLKLISSLDPPPPRNHLRSRQGDEHPSLGTTNIDRVTYPLL